MYESPINEIVNDICSELQKKEDEYVMKCVRNVGINVDKDELLKALAYDRKQYDKGYNDGYKDGLNEVLDKIRNEIRDWQIDIHDNEYDAEAYYYVFERIYKIIDEHKAESENKE